ncbi:MAG: hypothetical protein ACREV2_17360 [Burkholderiales bacterium]
MRDQKGNIDSSVSDRLRDSAQYCFATAWCHSLNAILQQSAAYTIACGMARTHGLPLLLIKISWWSPVVALSTPDAASFRPFSSAGHPPAPLTGSHL